jgi:glycosyltransferase involved in cell wall biosynthesis
MKITIIQGAFLPTPPVLGGAVEKLWFATAKEFVKAGHTVHYISRRFAGQPNEELVDGICFERTSGFTSPRFMLVRLVFDFIYSIAACRRIGKDTNIVVTNTFFAPILAPLLTSAPIVVDVARMPKGQMRFYTRAARLRATSSAVEKSIKASLPVRFHSIVKTIPNPLPFSPPPDIDSTKDNIVLYVGRVHPEKGLSLLGKASHDLSALGWRLVIIGPAAVAAGGGGDEYLSFLKSAFCPTTEFFGPLFDSVQLEEQYRRAKIFVYPSIAEKGESFGLAPLEAMAYGVVPVVSDLDCFRDFIVEGVNGFFFDWRTQEASDNLSLVIVSLAKNSSLLQRAAEEAKKVRSSHNTQTIAAIFLADFDTLCKQADS